jgi:hypothetical protein
MVGEPRTTTSQKATGRTAADVRPATTRLSVVLGAVREMPALRADGVRSARHSVGSRHSSDKLRRCARCTACGAKGATLQQPGWMGEQIGLRRFPFPIADEAASE